MIEIKLSILISIRHENREWEYVCRTYMYVVVLVIDFDSIKDNFSLIEFSISSCCSISIQGNLFT